MKIKLLLICTLIFSSCARTGIAESVWIDKEHEKMVINIEKEKGKFWLRYFNQPMEIVEEGADTYVLMRDQEIPLTIDMMGELLVFNKVEFIPLSKSMKDQFTGRWKNAIGDTIFLVQIDENRDLTWDIIKGSEKPIRFWPKPTASGFHFTYGEELLSFALKDGYIQDTKGEKYFKVSDI